MIAGVVQSGERRICNAVNLGSNPSAGSYYDPDDTYEFFKDVEYDEDDVEGEFE
jgi:hypothetical protein